MVCPISRTIDMLAKRWTLMLLHHLSLRKSMRFGEIQEALQGISARTLSERLRELEKEGILTRKSYPEIPPRVEYKLSNKGQELINGCFEPIERWAKKWKPG